MIARRFPLAATLAFLILNSELSSGQSKLYAPPAVVGTNLEATRSVALSVSAPDQGVDLLLRSGDPDKLLISNAPEKPGLAVLILRVRQGNRESPPFWLQALGRSGTVTYTAAAEGFSSASGTVVLMPSAIVMMGPASAPKFRTTTGAIATNVTLSSARLDSSLRYVEQQPVAGGRPVRIEIMSSEPNVGVVVPSTLEIEGGKTSADINFKPAHEGETALSLHLPPGFSSPADLATVTALVTKPGLAISDQVVIGRNLQVGGVLGLGEAAPRGGVEVTLASHDPQLLLSTSLTAIGSSTIKLKIPAGGVVARYYLQAIGDSGTVEYTATAPGYLSRSGIVSLTPSGIVLTPAAIGPPDEAQVVRTNPPDGTYQFTADLSDPTPSILVAWTVHLDPMTHRSADITVQPLRAGLSLTISLTNSNPSIGRVSPSVTIPAGSDHSALEFTPLRAGSTEISVTTPKDFTASANSTKVVAIVRN